MDPYDSPYDSPVPLCRYVLTEPIEGIKGMPVIRSYDESLYLKEDAGKLLIGLFEPNARPAWRDSNKVPMDFSFGSFPKI